MEDHFVALREAALRTSKSAAKIALSTGRRFTLMPTFSQYVATASPTSGR